MSISFSIKLEDKYIESNEILLENQCLQQDVILEMLSNLPNIVVINTETNYDYKEMNVDKDSNNEFNTGVLNRYSGFHIYDATKYFFVINKYDMKFNTLYDKNNNFIRNLPNYIKYDVLIDDTTEYGKDISDMILNHYMKFKNGIIIFNRKDVNDYSNCITHPLNDDSINNIISYCKDIIPKEELRYSIVFKPDNNLIQIKNDSFLTEMITSLKNMFCNTLPLDTERIDDVKDDETSDIIISDIYKIYPMNTINNSISFKLYNITKSNIKNDTKDLTKPIENILIITCSEKNIEMDFCKSVVCNLINKYDKIIEAKYIELNNKGE